MPKLRRKHIGIEANGTILLYNGRGDDRQWFTVESEDVDLLIDEIQKLRVGLVTEATSDE